MPGGCEYVQIAPAPIVARMGEVIEFRSSTRQVKLLTPPSFVEDIQTVEYRQDPLTGALCRINARRAQRPKQAPALPEPTEVMGKPGNCPFCPDNIEKATPRFPPDFSPKGHIQKGPCRLFPNLFPLAEHHAVAVLTETHFVPAAGFTVSDIMNSIAATLEYLALVYRQNPQAAYPLYVWNHLPPSAASIIHPHVQVLADRQPTTYQRRLLEAGREHRDRTGRNFWPELVEEEKKRGIRFIGGVGSVSALASYAPQGNREVLMVFLGASSLADLNDGQIADFAQVVVGLLHGYHGMGVSSFNLTTFSGPYGEALGYYNLNAKLIARPAFQSFYRNDTGVLERLHGEADIEMEPEEVAAQMRAFFRS